MIRVGCCVPVPDFLSSAAWTLMPEKALLLINQSIK